MGQGNSSKNDQYQLTFGRRMIELYRDVPSPHALHTGQGVTFEEYVEFLTGNDVTERAKYDVHWASYESLCLPCVVKYDYVLKTETFIDDVTHALRTLYRSNDVEIFSKVKNVLLGGEKTLKAFMEARGKRIREHAKLSADLRIALSDRYKTDIEMFGYKHGHEKFSTFLYQN